MQSMPNFLQAFICEHMSLKQSSVPRSSGSICEQLPKPLIGTPVAVIVGMVYNYLPYMILPLYTVMVKIEKPILEAAGDLGAGKGNVFARVILPLSKPGIVSGVTMVFVPAVSTFIISYLLGGGKTYLIGNIIENYFLGSSGAICG